MKKLLALLLAAVMVLSLAACGGSGKTAETQAPAAGNAAPAAPAASGGPISLTLWGAEEDQALLAELVEKFKAQYPDQTFDIKIGVESESTAKDTVLTDVEAAADVFAFANDQLNDLVAAGTGWQHCTGSARLRKQDHRRREGSQRRRLCGCIHQGWQAVRFPHGRRQQLLPVL